MKDGRFVNTQFSEGFGLAEIASHRPAGWAEDENDPMTAGSAAASMPRRRNLAADRPR